MDKSGTWSLAPAFDLIYSFNPSGTWTASHQMTLNGKRDDFTLEDFKACARAASMKRGRAEAIIKEVREKVLQWRDYADETGVPAIWRDQIQNTLRLEKFV
jgi:serine/threonine-protein kinase HipA